MNIQGLFPLELTGLISQQTKGLSSTTVWKHRFFNAQPSLWSNSAATAKSLQSCLTLCDPIDTAHQASLPLGFSRQEHRSGLPFPSPVHESEKWKWSCLVCPTLSDPMDCSHQAPPSTGFSRQEYWSGVPLPSSGPTLISIYDRWKNHSFDFFS